MYCSNCGKEISKESKFCRFCGHAGRGGGVNSSPATVVSTEKKLADNQVYIKRSGLRVVLMTIGSSGIYIFYWINCTLHNLERLTKKDLKHDSVTLRMIIPIYNIFVYGEFLRNINKLKAEYGEEDTISVGLHQFLVVLGYFLFGISTLVSMGIIQGHVNKLMDSISGGKALDAQFRKGEITVLIIGLLIWGYYLFMPETTV